MGIRDYAMHTLRGAAFVVGAFAAGCATLANPGHQEIGHVETIESRIPINHTVYLPAGIEGSVEKKVKYNGEIPLMGIVTHRFPLTDGYVQEVIARYRYTDGNFLEYPTSVSFTRLSTDGNYLSVLLLDHDSDGKIDDESSDKDVIGSGVEDILDNFK